jgi:hypothetical protein
MISQRCRAHLSEVGESPLKHLCSAVWVAIRLQGYVCACLVHAVVPCLFTHTTTDGIRQILEDRT